MKRKIIDGLIAIFSLGIFFISYCYKTGIQKSIICLISAVILLVFTYKFFKKDKNDTHRIFIIR